MMIKLILRNLLLLVLVTTTLNVYAISLESKTVDSTAMVNSSAGENALTEFKSLSRKERKSRITEAKKAVKEFRKNKHAGADTNTLLLCILAILLPPLAIYLKEGEINAKFWIGLLLTLLIWLPGVIYALLVILGSA